MLPPIRKQTSNNNSNSTSSNNPLSASMSGREQLNGGIGSGGAITSSSTSNERTFSSGSLNSFSKDTSTFMMERLHTLERENELFREEMQHLRRLVSNNQQQNQEEKMSFLKIHEDLQRLVSSFNAKVQADTLYQQKEQQKSALLFAEVSRLGQNVDTLEHALKNISEETKKRIETFEQQQHKGGFSPLSSSFSSSITTAMHSQELHKQMEEMQTTIHILKTQLNQLRTEIEGDKNERWKVESEKNNLLSDLRGALSKTDASIENRITNSLERFHSKMTMDKMEIMRIMEEQRELMTSTDFKRVSSQMIEFTRINDHLNGLEQYIQKENGQMKKILQLLFNENDHRFQVLMEEMTQQMKFHFQMIDKNDSLTNNKLVDLTQAMDLFAMTIRKQLNNLEEVFPLEVKARQKQLDKYKKKMDQVIKSLSKAIETIRDQVSMNNFSTEITNCKTRMVHLEQNQRQIVDQMEEKQEIVKETIAEFIKDSDTMLGKLATLIEQEKQEKTKQQEHLLTVKRTNEEETSTSIQQQQTQVLKKEIETQLLQLVQTMLDEKMSFFSSLVMEDFALRGNVFLEKLENLDKETQEQIGNLQHWSSLHTKECREYYDYLHFQSMTSQHERDIYDSVQHLVNKVVDHVTQKEMMDLQKQFQSFYQVEKQKFAKKKDIEQVKQGTVDQIQDCTHAQEVLRNEVDYMLEKFHTQLKNLGFLKEEEENETMMKQSVVGNTQMIQQQHHEPLDSKVLMPRHGLMSLITATALPVVSESAVISESESAVVSEEKDTMIIAPATKLLTIIPVTTSDDAVLETTESDAQLSSPTAESKASIVRPFQLEEETKDTVQVKVKVDNKEEKDTIDFNSDTPQSHHQIIEQVLQDVVTQLEGTK